MAVMEVFCVYVGHIWTKWSCEYLENNLIFV